MYGVYDMRAQVLPRLPDELLVKIAKYDIPEEYLYYRSGGLVDQKAARLRGLLYDRSRVFSSRIDNYTFEDTRTNPRWSTAHYESKRNHDSDEFITEASKRRKLYNRVLFGKQ